MGIGSDFTVSSIKGANGGQVDYRLARRAIVNEFKKGRVARNDVCDAHPELMRAARNVGDGTSIDCPICEETKVVLVSFAFGARLGAAGRCVTMRDELMKLSRTSGGPVTTYVVEVCPLCSWNHLTRAFVMEQPSRATKRANSAP